MYRSLMTVNTIALIPSSEKSLGWKSKPNPSQAKMKSTSFSFFLLILCAQALWSSALASLSPSNRMAQRWDAQDLKQQNSTGQFGKGDDGTRYKKNEKWVYSIKARGGRGAVGGGGSSVAHHPQKSVSMGFRSAKAPSLFVTTITACVSLGWFLASPF